MLQVCQVLHGAGVGEAAVGIPGAGVPPPKNRSPQDSLISSGRMGAGETSEIDLSSPQLAAARISVTRNHTSSGHCCFAAIVSVHAYLNTGRQQIRGSSPVRWTNFPERSFVYFPFTYNPMSLANVLYNRRYKDNKRRPPRLEI